MKKIIRKPKSAVKTAKTEKTTPKKSTGVKNTSKNIQKELEEKKKDTGRVEKYQYPKDCKTSQQKKDFRTKQRAAFRRFEKQISNAKPKEKAQLEKEFNTFKEETFTAGKKATIGL